MKRQLRGLLCLVALILASGCTKQQPASGAEENSESQIETSTQSETGPRIEVADLPFGSDYNRNGIDDRDDLMAGAREEAARHPRYDGAYLTTNDGYPTEDSGVCTDVIWRAYRSAGYDLGKMVNADIRKRPSDYPRVDRVDPLIDFRRVKNLMVYFGKYGETLTEELSDPALWQAGDIVTFDPNDFHIGICSDKRNRDGFPYVFHNMGQPKREEDVLSRMDISGHYRFDPLKSELSKDMISPWERGAW